MKKPKRPGRPKGSGKGIVHSRVFQMRVTTDFLRALDQCRKRQDDHPSRAEMLRRLVKKYAAESE
jgi:hypothetical protein